MLQMETLHSITVCFQQKTSPSPEFSCWQAEGLFQLGEKKKEMPNMYSYNQL